MPKDVYLQAIENTNLLPDMVTPWEIDRSYKYPHLWENPEKLFLQKIKEGIDHRGIKSLPNYNEYRERILYEIEGYKHNGAVDFMLLMTDIADWCKAHDILLGYGRGSVNGSVIAWLLGITEMDAVKYNLNFERFMSKERVSLSDIDSDLPPSRREEVKDYLFAKDGLPLNDRYDDCGTMLFDAGKQDVHAGASGCGCSAVTLCGDLLNKLNSGRLKRILFCGTGALLSPTSTQQGLPIPGVCHAVCITGGM